MEKTIEIPEGYEARIEGNKVILERKESEDEGIRKFIIACIDELRKANAENAEFNDRCSESIAYLERQKEQKPAEWSEEDEHYFQNLIMAVDSTFGDGNTKNWLQNRLKSLRHKPHWRPSEEQMKALKEAVDEFWEADGLHPLYTLYDDLKKL